ncbi:hypothetical protein [Gordonia sp. NB41Y]|uniref:hypothetical protein n=1 Tax=Gordonia sp. NB41Y TaxID=875808 RepID=UPI0006B189B1|nr:hypothetical protein [Gordonia sp. NB41Y]KOY49568.1 hypothetical protein ISGA_09360 [Gordonia sp. NB41Y]WLP89055.1 hypothetical protein Q9K23_15750 [Gordonia sp. NB41Y]
MDYTTITLKAAAKAMEDAVLPALSAAGEQQALEQAHLVWDAIRFVADRVDLVAARRRAEAIALIDLVGRLAELDAVDDATTARLGGIRSAAMARIADPETTAEGYAVVIAGLGDEVTAVLRTADQLAPAQRAGVERTVLAHALRRLELDRSWLLPLGFDPDPAGVPELAGLLAAGTTG